MKLLLKHSIKSDMKYKMYPQLFSSSEYTFIPTKKDWIIVKKFIHTVLLKVTNRCNSYCKLCFENSSPFCGYEEDLNFFEIKAILKLIGKNKRVALFGGEPTIRSDFFEIIKEIKKSGNSPEVYTNGLKLSNESFVKRIKDVGIERIFFSFDGFREDIYEILRTNKIGYYLKIKAIENLLKITIPTFFCSVIAKGINEDQIEPLLKYVVKSVNNKKSFRGIKFLGATYGDGRYLLDKNTVMKASEIGEIIEDLTGNAVKISYMREIQRFRINLFKIFSSFGLNFSIGMYSLMGFYKVRNYRLIELIDEYKLEKINNYIENGNYIKIFNLLDKNFFENLLKLFVLHKGKLTDFILNSRIITIDIGNISISKSYLKSGFQDCIEIFKNGEERIIEFKKALNWEGEGRLEPS